MYHMKYEINVFKKKKIKMYKLSRDKENVNSYRPGMLFRTGPKLKVKMKIAFTDI